MLPDRQSIILIVQYIWTFHHHQSLVQLSEDDYMNCVSPFRSILSQIFKWVALIQIYFYHLHPHPLRPTPSPWWAINLHCQTFLINAVASLHWICPNHLKHVFLILSPIDVTPNCSQNCSFLILSFLLDWPIFCSIGRSWANHCSIKFSFHSCWHSLVTKHSGSKAQL